TFSGQLGWFLVINPFINLLIIIIIILKIEQDL
uniref:Uncharacterized protein n=1 Tax=Amphimedon queenslandica TaxID=400682 RepID=A0A1X7TYZ6_AMPQE